MLLMSSINTYIESNILMIFYEQKLDLNRDGLVTWDEFLETCLKVIKLNYYNIFLLVINNLNLNNVFKKLK